MSALTVTLAEVEAAIRIQQRNRWRQFFPETGQFARSKYAQHLKFFAAGARFKERLFMAANRVGKSEAGAYEMACHLTGKYPGWWEGRRFSQAVEAWACGTTTETTRDIVQRKLLGPIGQLGTGMIPGDLIVHTTPRRGVADAIETVWVQHVSGKRSMLGLKTYEQGRSSFEGTAKHVIWADEEPPEDVYTEMLYRTITTRGIALITFTPLQGMSNVVKGFLEPETPESAQFKTYIQAGWNDVPHIPDEEKKALLATTPPYQAKARMEGEPSLGAGAIYPIAESDIVCEPFLIPDSWRRVYALDVGWNRTAALWMAQNPGNGQLVFYDEHYQGQGEPASHAQSIRARGEWIRGVIDPASVGSSQIDGRSLMDAYRNLGLNLSPAINDVEAGIMEVWNLLVSGRLKVMTSCQNFLREFRKYHRDERGKIVKADDHLMDCGRYNVKSGVSCMTLKPRSAVTQESWQRESESEWMV